MLPLAQDECMCVCVCVCERERERERERMDHCIAALCKSCLGKKNFFAGIWMMTCEVKPWKRREKNYYKLLTKMKKERGRAKKQKKEEEKGEVQYHEHH